MEKVSASDTLVITNVYTRTHARADMISNGNAISRKRGRKRRVNKTTGVVEGRNEGEKK